MKGQTGKSSKTREKLLAKRKPCNNTFLDSRYILQENKNPSVLPEHVNSCFCTSATFSPLSSAGPVHWGSEVNDVNQTGTRHYLECAANLQTKRLKLCLIMFLISPDTDIAVIVVYQG